MPTDTERREVARRLREVQSDVIPGTKTEVHPIAGRIIGVACGYGLPDFQGLLGRLADLIEPSIPADPGEAGLACVDAFIREHTEKPVDRDALLKLADEIDCSALELLKTNDLDPNRKRRAMRREHAQDLMVASSRIREACGVTADE